MMNKINHGLKGLMLVNFWICQISTSRWVNLTNVKCAPEMTLIQPPRSTGGWSGPKDQQNRHDMFLSLTGVKKVIIGSRKPKAIELAKMLGIDILSTKILSKEAETLSCILKTFKGQEMKEQYTVDGYRIDLYFPTQKLAIECDEFGHKDRDISYEVTRQNHIETKLGCTFIRYNPDAKDFDIFDVLNSIINHIF